MIKDNVDVAGMPTCEGTDTWVGYPARRDGDFARMFLATGLIPLGKSQLSEYGFSASAEHPRLGPVRNPWSLDHTAGASSSGSAALVAAGAVPIAHANDGGGSIRIPASVNGLVGLKPTRGRLAQDKVMREHADADHLRRGRHPQRARHRGVLPRGREGLPLAEAAADRRHHPARVATGSGSPSTPPGSARGADAEVTELTLKTARLLEELGPHGRRGRRPGAGAFPDDFLLYWSTLAMFLMRNGRRLHGRTFDRTQHDNLTLGLALHATPQPAPHPRRDPAAAHRHAPLGRVLQAVRRVADARRWRTRPRASATSTPPRTTTRSWTACSTGSRSPRCRTSPVTRRSRCRWPRRRAGCRWA